MFLEHFENVKPVFVRKFRCLKVPLYIKKNRIKIKNKVITNSKTEIAKPSNIIMSILLIILVAIT